MVGAHTYVIGGPTSKKGHVTCLDFKFEGHCVEECCHKGRFKNFHLNIFIYKFMFEEHLKHKTTT